MNRPDRNTIDQFWPDASSKLDKHFARKKVIKRLKIAGLAGLVIVIAAITFVWLKSGDVSNKLVNNQKQLSVLNSNEAELNRVNGGQKTAGIQNSFEDSMDLEKSSNLEDSPLPFLERSDERNDASGQRSTIAANNAIQILKPNESIQNFSNERKVEAASLSDQQVKKQDAAKDAGSFAIGAELKAGALENEVVFPVYDKEVISQRDEQNAKLARNEDGFENVKLSRGIEALQDTTDSNSENQVALLTERNSVDSVNVLKGTSNSDTAKIEATPLGGIVPELEIQPNEKWKFSLVPSIGIFNVRKQLAGSDNQGEYLLRRKQEEVRAFRESARLGFEISKNRISMQTGLYYSVYGERTAYSNWLYSNLPQIQLNTETNFDTTVSITSVVDMGNFYQIVTTNIDTNSITFADTVMVTAQTNINAVPYQVQNRIRYFELPFALRYTLYRNHALDLGFSAGGSLGLLWRSSGYVVNSTMDEFVNLDESDSFKKMVWNARIAMDVRFKLADRLWLGMRPEWNANLNSVFNSDVGINQRYKALGFMLEVGKSF